MNAPGQFRSQLRDYVLTLAADGRQTVQVNGDYVHLLESEGAEIVIYTDAGDRFDVIEGQGAKINRFTEVKFWNPGTVSRTIKVLVGTGEFRSTRIEGEVTPKPGTALVNLGLFRATQTVPANTDRRELLMRPSDSNTGAMYVSGLPLHVGDTMALGIEGAVDDIGADNPPQTIEAVGPAIGDEVHGGIYAGTITYADGRQFHIIAAHAAGEVYGDQWGTYTIETGVNDPDDGWANQLALLDNWDDGSLEAFYHCRDHATSGGFSDWYMPAINELKLLYDNLAGHAEFADNVASGDATYSSTELEQYNAEGFFFSTGYDPVQALGKSNTIRRTRPVRRVEVGEPDLATGDTLQVAEVV